MSSDVTMQREEELLPPILEPIYESDEQRLGVVRVVQANFIQRAAGSEPSPQRARRASA
ncbi:MAG: hypothetical protein JNN08_31845 [Bryobacterales bacterium]|nr:hypothetical protein [Bryobacterales bacterium]